MAVKKIDELRQMSEEDLKKLKHDTLMELAKANGMRHAGYGISKEWHPPFSDWRKTIARIETVLGEMRRNIGERKK